MTDQPADTTVAKLRIPLDDKRASLLRSVVAEVPEHHITVEGPFLVVYEGLPQ